jgi:hypothetical protein
LRGTGKYDGGCGYEFFHVVLQWIVDGPTLSAPRSLRNVAQRNGLFRCA